MNHSTTERIIRFISSSRSSSLDARSWLSFHRRLNVFLFLLLSAFLCFSIPPFSSHRPNSIFVLAVNTCFGIVSTDVNNVCGGHGICQSTDSCYCLDICSKNSLRNNAGAVSLAQSNDLISTNGRFKASMQVDGNFVIYDLQSNQAIWSTGTNGQGSQPYSLVLDSSGGLRVYGNGAVISTLVQSCSALPATLVQQNDGHLVLYGSGKEVCWSAGTYYAISNTYVWTGGSDCSVTTCYGIASNSGSVCSGHGSCTYLDTCSCNSGYGGSKCDTYYCNGIIYNSGSVCSGHGSCNSPNTCSCQSGYSGSNCETYYCNGILYNSTSVCNSRGTCSASETCVCNANYGGTYCQIPKCFGILQTATGTVCSGHGTCNDVDTCACNTNWGGPSCSFPMCFGILQNETNSVCHGHGSCNDVDTCACVAGWGGSQCSMPTCNNILQNQTGLVCGGHGTCDGPDTCHCNSNFTGPFCQYPFCYGIPSNASTAVCSGHGVCTGVDTCVCNSNWAGSDCSMPKCFGVLQNSTTVCSGHGTCNDANVCACNSNWDGPDCSMPKCFGILQNMTSSVCSGHGSCNDVDTCLCNPNWSGSNCSIPMCFGILQNQTSEVCNGRGSCNGVDTCVCNSNWGGSNCSIPKCFGILQNMTGSVCSGHGSCQNVDTCVCDLNWGGPSCSLPTCFGILQNETSSVCNGHGSCNAVDTCVCNLNYGGPSCALPKCFGVLQNMTSTVCSGHGSCIDVNTCSCLTGWVGLNCSMPTCFGILQNSTSTVCSGHGSCVNLDTCSCMAGWGGPSCALPKCFGILQNETNSVCHGHGSCNDVDTCACVAGWGGSQCSMPTCNNILQNQTGIVCGGHGTCDAPNVCRCNPGWSGDFCFMPSCFGILQNITSSICSGHGICTNVDTCLCHTNWTGLNCSIPTCFGFLQNSTNVCSGHGSCTNVDTCVCDSNWGGPSCALPKCFGILQNVTSSVCSGHGSCNAVDTCVCDLNWGGPSCSLPKCFGILQNQTGIVCNGQGTCDTADVCRCNSNFSGEWCQYPKCYNTASNETATVCSGHGACMSPNNCSCLPTWIGADCSVTTCFNELSNTSNVCSGKGSCTSFDHCNCNSNYFGNKCELTTCYGITSNNSLVCSNNGQCSSFNNCTCSSGYDGSMCENYRCYGIPFNSTNTCSGKGICVSPNKCVCNPGFSNFDCSVVECFNKFSNTSDVCSGKGNCSDYNNCTCQSGFVSMDCSVNINPYVISLSSTSMQIDTSSNMTSVEVQMNIPTDVNPLMTSFYWYCLNCQGISNSSVFMLGSNQQKLTIAIRELKAPGSYLFHANATTLNPFPFPTRISNTEVFNLTLLVPYVPNLSVPSLGVFGLPSAFVSTRNGGSGQTISAVISNIVLNQTNIEKFLGCKANCTTSLTYSWQLTSTSSSSLEASSTGSISAFTGGNNLMILQPPIIVSATLRNLVSNSKIGFALALFNNQMLNISSRVDIPVLPPVAPPTNSSLPVTNNTNAVISSLVQVVPAEGVALTDTFTINITAWKAPRELLPLRYAVGFYDKTKGKDVRFTDFSLNLTITVYLPFIQNKARRRNVHAALSQVDLVVYVMDALGNVDSQSSNVTVTVAPFNGTSTELLQRINQLSGTSLMVASFDQSYTALSSTSGGNSSAVIYELVKNIVIDPKNPSVALSSFESLTSNSDSINDNIVSAVTTKLSSFVDGVKNTYSDEKKLYGFVKSKLSDQDVTSTISVSSNLLSSGVSSDKTRNVTENISSMVLLGEVAKVIDQSSSAYLPTVSYSTSLINITISSFKLNSGISINQTLSSGSNSVELSISQILTQYNAFSKECGVSMIEYAKNTNYDNYTSNNVITSVVNDFKFIQEQTPLILNNLNQPIILTFKLDSSSLQGKNISNSTFTCRYWDEEGRRWSNNGCFLHRVDIPSKTIECACYHTTMFTTFLEQKTTVNMLEVKDQVAALYFSQIVFGCIYTAIAIFLLVSLIVLRKEQPVTSRLLTPYVGLIALITESILIYIIQRGVLVNQLLGASTQMWETGDTAANVIANIVTIFVNTLNLSAILCYVLQVFRFQLMKFLYQQMSNSRGNEKNSERILKALKYSTSAALFYTIIAIFAAFNVCYWTLWVILVRTGAISSPTYSYIVSISYLVCILTFSIVICTVAIFDWILSSKKEVEVKNSRRRPTNNFSQVNSIALASDSGENLKDPKKKNLITLPTTVMNWFISLDQPLYFRMEMVIYMVCFIFQILNLIIGSSSLSFRFDSNESYKKALTLDGVSFIFEVFYVVSYLFVFGGFALIVALIYKFKRSKKKQEQLQKRKEEQKKNQEELINKEMHVLLEHEEGYKLFEAFCQKEFSLENLYLYSDLKANPEITQGQQLGGIVKFMSFLYNTYVKTGATHEVNIPSKCRNSFLYLYKNVLESRDQLISTDLKQSADNYEGDIELVDKDIKFATKNNPIPRQEIDAETVSNCFEFLLRQVMLNIGDTFSRFVFTPEYKSFQKSLEMQQTIMDKVGVVYGI